MASIPSDTYNSMTGYTANAFLESGTAADMNGTDAQLDHATAPPARSVRTPRFACEHKDRGDVQGEHAVSHQGDGLKEDDMAAEEHDVERERDRTEGNGGEDY